MDKHIENYNLFDRFREVLTASARKAFHSGSLIIHQIRSKVNVDMGERGLIASGLRESDKRGGNFQRFLYSTNWLFNLVNGFLPMKPMIKLSPHLCH